jgi:UDP-galactopyranose mutase
MVSTAEEGAAGGNSHDGSLPRRAHGLTPGVPAVRESSSDGPNGCDVLVVGAGCAGSVMAEQLASRAGLRVLVVDRRPHIAGNAYDEFDGRGVLIHRYGPHVFHTNCEAVWQYLSRFTDWRPYEHRVLAAVEGQLLPMPINRITLNRLYGLHLADEKETEAFLAERAEPRARIENSEDSVVARIGWDLYEKFFRGYTTKQWGLDPEQLDAQVCARIPVRSNDDDRYFTDTFQRMPREGYTAMFRRILDHPLIRVLTGVDYADVRDEIEYGHLVWTGSIDELYGYRYGALPYRSLVFENRSYATPDGGLVQPAAAITFPSPDVPHTRVTEYRRITGQRRHDWTTLQTEYPRAEGDPYYPIPRAENRTLYRRYAALAEQHGVVTLVGRLARYQYLNMDQVVAQALVTFERLMASGKLPAHRGAAHPVG